MWSPIFVDETSSNVRIKRSSLKGLPLHFKNQIEKERIDGMTKKNVLDGIVCLKKDWPKGRALDIYPGDFSLWAQDSNPRTGCFLRDPIRDAPKRRARGGVFYLNTMTSRDGFQQELFNAGINSRKTRYAVFMARAANPQEENYFRQLRIVTNYALRDYYGALNEDECEEFPRQVCGVGEAFWRFMGEEVNSCNSGRRDAYEEFEGERIRGRIRFGLTVERSVKVESHGNVHNDGVYRMWSQPYYPQIPIYNEKR